MDKIFIKDLLVRGIIGINDWERNATQDILINVTVFTDTRHVGETDDLSDSVNYRTLAKRMQAHTETAGRFTVEALANDLAALCLEEKGVAASARAGGEARSRAIRGLGWGRDRTPARCVNIGLI